MDRSQVIARLESLRDQNEYAFLAFYAYRDLNRTEPEPFLKAALERSPVSIAGCKDLDDEAVVALVQDMSEESIYDESGRLAQPDEVWNYRRGDGVEKALLVANVFHSRHPDWRLVLEVTPHSATLVINEEQKTYRFASRKNLRPQVWDLSLWQPGPGQEEPVSKSQSNSSVSSEV